MILVDSLESLIKQEAVLRFSDVQSELNMIYSEGLEATKANHFIERTNCDFTFNTQCDGCNTEIEFLLFTCLGCRSRSLCEPCYFKQLKGLEADDDDELTLSENLRCSSPDFSPGGALR